MVDCSLLEYGLYLGCERGRGLSVVVTHPVKQKIVPLVLLELVPAAS